jgi:release factor glutamine methyltransferase
MNDVRSGLANAARALSAVSDTARLDVELLMAHALAVSRETMLLGRQDHQVPAGFAALLARRLTHEPVAYITGKRDFWTISLDVSPAVLIPRPDSETLIEAAVAHFGARGPKRIVDLGTGSGALLLAALSHWPDATGVGTDISEAALAVAKDNAERLGLAPRVQFNRSDWAQGLSEHFDLVLCNPPYVETGALLAPEVINFEPAGALFAGASGLDDYQRLLPQIACLMSAGGVTALEIGADQAGAVSGLAAQSRLSATCFRDLGGRNRCLLLQYQTGL